MARKSKKTSRRLASAIREARHRIRQAFNKKAGEVLDDIRKHLRKHRLRIKDLGFTLFRWKRLVARLKIIEILETARSGFFRPGLSPEDRDELRKLLRRSGLRSYRPLGTSIAEIRRLSAA